MAQDIAQETVFTYGAPQLKFGTGASDEVGHDLLQYGVRRALVVTDPGVAATGHPQRIADQMAQFGIEAVVYDGAHVEPTDESMQRAIDWARAEGPWDAFVAVGGGSAIDTAKAVNLLTSNEGELMDYVNAPVGKARNPEQPLKPLVAVPTTTGTGAESTTVCVLDVLSLKVKTGISHARLRPTLAVVDPTLTMSQPAGVTAASGMDILCHALESYTARPYTSYDRKQPEQRVPYCGSNPIADMWSEKAMSLLATSFRGRWAMVTTSTPAEEMAMAATFAGLGFGNAGVHIPHANAYPIAGRVRDFHPDGYLGRRADGAARDGGVADRARGVPVHLRVRARTPPARCIAAGAGQHLRRRPRPARPGADRPDERHRDPQRTGGGRLRLLRRRRTS